jgi:hypothetical protein
LELPVNEHEQERTEGQLGDLYRKGGKGKEERARRTERRRCP